MREASENVRQAEPLCVSAPEPTGESRLAGSEELVFIL
jgi:hypothetical protein